MVALQLVIGFFDPACHGGNFEDTKAEHRPRMSWMSDFRNSINAIFFAGAQVFSSARWLTKILFIANENIYLFSSAHVADENTVLFSSAHVADENTCIFVGCR
jgi:hypothetical protein